MAAKEQNYRKKTPTNIETFLKTFLYITGTVGGRAAHSKFARNLLNCLLTITIFQFIEYHNFKINY